MFFIYAAVNIEIFEDNLCVVLRKCKPIVKKNLLQK